MKLKINPLVVKKDYVEIYRVIDRYQDITSILFH